MEHYNQTFTFEEKIEFFLPNHKEFISGVFFGHNLDFAID